MYADICEQLFRPSPERRRLTPAVQASAQVPTACSPRQRSARLTNDSTTLDPTGASPARGFEEPRR